MRRERKGWGEMGGVSVNEDVAEGGKKACCITFLPATRSIPQ